MASANNQRFLVRGLLLLAFALTSRGWTADPPLPSIPPPPAPPIDTPKPEYDTPALPPLPTRNGEKPAPTAPAASSTTRASEAWQGEYTGRVMIEGGLEWYGMQLVSQGKGTALLVIYTGGLPGNLWNGTDREALESQAKPGESLSFRWGERDVIVGDDSELRVLQGGVQIGRLVQVIRKSRSLGATPPAGAVVLFNGSSADAFSPGGMDELKLLQQGAISKQSFGSFQLHLEFQTPFMPEARGQGRGNSGVYLQGRYELQVLDSFGLQSQDNDCGGIYKVAPPQLNMCFPPLSWQTYDIDFQAARFDANGKKIQDAIVTIEHNGIVIHDKLSIPNVTGGERLAEGPTGGPLYLQDHGNPVRYRNIWLVETEPAPPLEITRPVAPKPNPPKPALTPIKPKQPERKAAVPKAPAGRGWKPLFDGKTLAGWHTNREQIGHGTGGHWFVSEGTIVGEQDPPGSGNGGILLTDQKYDNFELSLELRPDWGVDSGLFLRSTDKGACLQVMVDYHDDGNVGQIYGEGTGGFTNRTFSLHGQSDRAKPNTVPLVKSLSTKPVDGSKSVEFDITGDKWLEVWRVNDWNTLRVRVEGNPVRITTWINDTKVSEFNGETFDGKNYDRKGVQKELGDSGKIALQVHGGKSWPSGATVRWRNLWLRPIDSTPAPSPAKSRVNTPEGRAAKSRSETK